jgi:exodeoxyribonuclease-3
MALRLLSYNILMGGEDRLQHIAHVIAQQQPDVVALLEANERTNAETLARQLQMNLTFGTANSEFHVVWLSRLPIIRAENHRLAQLAKTLLEIEVQWEETPVTLFATHLQAGRNQESEQLRVAEMHAILSVLQQHAHQPHALVGDFNSLHPTDQTDIPLYLATAPEQGEEQMRADQFHRQVIPLLLQAGYMDCYRILHPETPGYTYKLPAPSLRLDYIFASPSLSNHLWRCDIITGAQASIASDHFPLWAEFR